jgi:hypothetical protein
MVEEITLALLLIDTVLKMLTGAALGVLHVDFTVGPRLIQPTSIFHNLRNAGHAIVLHVSTGFRIMALVFDSSALIVPIQDNIT